MLVGLSFDSTAGGVEGGTIHGSGFMTLPTLRRGIAFGHRDRIVNGDGDEVPGYGLFATLPALTLTGQGGARGAMALPALALTGSGTVTIVGRGDMRLPALALEASGTMTLVGRGSMTLPGKYAISGRGGAIGRGTLPALQLTGSGLLGRIGRGSMNLPGLTLEASGSVGIVGRGLMTLPALVAAPSAVLVATLPALTLQARGTLAEISVAYEAYSLTLIPSDSGDALAASHYTDYPFERILRFRNSYYGVAADGLYELTGDTFDGDPIVASVVFPAHDYKTPNVKRGRALHIAGRLGGDAQVSAQVGEDGTDRRYVYKPAVRSGARNNRVLLGRGLASRYWSFGFSNTNGEDFTLEEVTAEFDVQRRTVGT